MECCILVRNWMKCCLGLSWVMLILWLVPVAQASEVEGLYQAKVPVISQTRDERLDIYSAALAQVVVKMSGDRTAPTHPELAGFMKRANTLVQQFHYQELPPGSETLIEEGYKRVLVVSFDGKAISQALIEANVPLWGRTRPEVLLWLAIEDRGARYLLAANASEELESHLNDLAYQRGLPLILPLVDLEDQAQLEFADVWGDFRQTILRASQRYGVDAVLIGRLIRSGQGGWQSRWSLHYSADISTPSEFWQAEANSQTEALAFGIGGATDLIAQRYAQVFTAGAADAVVLKVKAVNDLADYARAMKYLESLDIVTNVDVVKVSADEVLFKLAIRGDSYGLENAIVLGNTLTKSSETTTYLDDETVSARAFIYQLLP